LLDRDRREQWLEQGGTTLGQRLRARVQEILKEARPQALDTGKAAQIQQILAQAT
jgi:trimethylamine:corrinoid methyltransferase-like protein